MRCRPGGAAEATAGPLPGKSVRYPRCRKRRAYRDWLAVTTTRGMGLEVLAW